MGNGTRFALEFSGQPCIFFCFFFGPFNPGLFDCIMFILVWFETSFPPAQVPLKLMKSKSIQGTCIHTGVYGEVRERMG